MDRISVHRAERIARNINAMDLNYQYSDDGSTWRFWNDLNKKLMNILSGLSDEDKSVIKNLCQDQRAKYFGLA